MTNFYVFGFLITILYCGTLTFMAQSSIIEVECEYESDYHCETKMPPVVCAIIDVIVSNNFTKLLIVNNEEFEFNAMKIRQSRFHAFPVELLDQLSNLQTINVYKADMKEIKDFTFANATFLTELNIFHNELSEVTENALRGATALKELSLNRNQIKVIHPKAFETLEKLQYLDLTQNLLESVDAKTFAPLTNLKHLFLSECQIKTIAVTSFVKNVNLSTLSLDENLLEQLELDLSADSLKTIYLHINKLKKVVLHAKSPVASVREVYAGFNELEEIVVDTNLSLKRLSINNNKIQSLKNISQLSTLMSLQLSANPIKDLTKIDKLLLLKRLYLDKTQVELRPDIFGSLASLKSIHLSKMSLTKLDVAWLRGLSGLELLNLGENQLENLNYKDFATELPSLRGIMLNNNSFNCSYLGEMLGYLKNNTFIKILDADADNTTSNIDKITCNDGSDSTNHSHVFRSVLITLTMAIGFGIFIFALGTVAKRYEWKIATYMNYRSYSNMTHSPSSRLVNESQ